MMNSKHPNLTWQSALMLALFVWVCGVTIHLDRNLQLQSADAQSIEEPRDRQDIPREEVELEEDELAGVALDTNLLETDSADQPIRKLTITHVFQILIITTVIIWGYSLVMSGKQGQGWLVLTAIAAVFAYVFRLIKSVFQEVTAKNEVGDWDDE